jgi:hypothetical protein
MIDDNTARELLRINKELFELCKWLDGKGDIETSARLIPLVHELTRILLQEGKNKGE